MTIVQKHSALFHTSHNSASHQTVISLSNTVYIFLYIYKHQSVSRNGFVAFICVFMAAHYKSVCVLALSGFSTYQYDVMNFHSLYCSIVCLGINMPIVYFLITLLMGIYYQFFCYYQKKKKRAIINLFIHALCYGLNCTPPNFTC